jgi:signal transduction histidine kinase
MAAPVPPQTKLIDLIGHVRWYIKLRWVYIFSLGISWLGGYIVFKGFDRSIIRDVYLLLFGALMNGAFSYVGYRRRRNKGYYYRLALLMLTTDIMTASIIIFEHGGFQARTIILYGIPIFIAGALFGRRTLVYTILAASVAYDGAILVHSLVHHNFEALTGDNLLLIAFYNTVFAMIGIVAKRALDKTTESLKIRNRELMRFNQAKDEFISIASHQLRTPATAVKQYIGMLETGVVGQPTARQKELLQKAYASNERQLKMVTELLQIARIDAGKLKARKRRTDMRSLVEDVVAEQLPQFKERSQAVSIDLPSKATLATVDANLIRMALENIINNASKYSREGKSVRIMLKPKASHVDILIIDEGIGISETEKQRLFQKFVRLENAGDVSGSGLGLYWAKKVIDLHGGQITIDSRKRKGSTFTITLPTVTEKRRLPVAKAAAA